MARTLLIFVKAPRLGQVKRRLGRDIGGAEAWSFYRRTTRRLILRLARDPRWHCQLVVTPDSFDGRERFWPLSCPVVKQGAGNLGKRMQRALERAPSGPAVLVGSDIPDLMPCHIAKAFAALGRADAVFGPAEDGGFWLVGLSPGALRANPFANVAWSSPRALADTVANLPKSYSVAMVDMLSDIDVGADHAMWRARQRQEAEV
ncbi:MAG: TIGR04282 family arsenosugar biosynthesis glycosyltransferase [Proteobacteria bacterium]|nr:TIGR04282 family arsenosugar biosynthesis glycosyltransferase [Pseudomonadota bacterium]MDA1355606.1 TIGR04282 family arsenosugar biosynthesis glycosyltransferase [Pseudomonadota bacterium]